MKLKDHSTISNLNQIKKNEVVYLLFNGIVCMGIIKEIKNEDVIKARIFYNKAVTPVLVNKKSIYLEKPPHKHFKQDETNH